jgi:hypothetical protein
MSKEKKEKDKEKSEAIAGTIAVGIVLLLAIWWGYRWFNNTWERAKRQTEQTEKEAQTVLKEVKEVLSIKGFYSRIDAMIRLMEIEGHELKIVKERAVPTSGDWWKVSFYLLKDGSEQDLYEWNYNRRTKEIFPTP